MQRHRLLPVAQLKTGDWTPGDDARQALVGGALAFDEPANCASIDAGEAEGGGEVLFVQSEVTVTD